MFVRYLASCWCQLNVFFVKGKGGDVGREEAESSGQRVQRADGEEGAGAECGGNVGHHELLHLQHGD